MTESKQIELNVRWFPSPHGPEAYLQAPCIEIWVAPPSDTLNVSGYYKTWALIDTGADADLIDKTLASELNLPIIRQSNVQGNFSANKQNVFHANLYMKDANFIIQATPMEMTFVEKREFRLVLGRRSLQHCRFQYDGHATSLKMQFEVNYNAK